ncbi:MAG: HIT family protein [Leptospiraceae bacterium]|nr:HIT family protein [Leptospiraceae bacterium]MCP5496614.1 HIT family protein [Leptospiraceae bacterium]
MKIYEDELVYIEIEKSEIPWLKIFTQKKYKEFSDCDTLTKTRILELLDKIERLMIEFYKPDKINIASFGNYLPQVHFHIMARFKNDSYFPEPMWGQKQRVARLNLPEFSEFQAKLLNSLLKS